MTRPRLLFYCQHSLGLGHLSRSLAVARGLTAYFDVVLLNGGRFPDGTALPAEVAVVNLPPLGHGPDYQLVSHDPRFTVEQACARRRQMILDALDRESPAVVLIEMYPFGRKKFEFELLPLLEAVAAQAHRPRVVCSLRDILVNQRSDQARHDERASRRVNSSFDAVLVHSDPTFARLEESFDPVTPLQVPLHHTGFVTPAETTTSGGDRDIARLPRLLVSAGGGMVGEPLFREAVAVHRAVAARTGLRTKIVAGPFLPEPAWAWLQDQAAGAPLLDVVRRVDDLCLEMRRSAMTLSQGGYNTTMDILRAQTPAMVVPYSEGKEDEQTRRAERLARLGALRMLPTAELSEDRLLRELCSLSTSQPAPVCLDLSGRTATAEIVWEMVDANRHHVGALSVQTGNGKRS